jgi:transcription elongation GreA/GreB family factor
MSETAVLPEEVAALVEQKKLDALEDVWTRRMEERSGDLPFFFALAAAVKKKGSGTKAVSWLKFLADFCAESGDLEGRTRVLFEIARMSPTDETVRTELRDTLSQRFAGHPSLAAVLAQFPLEKAKEPTETAARIERWLRYRVGDVYALAGRGAGRIAELNPALDVIRLEISGTRVPLSLVSADRNLVPLPQGHFLRDKVEDPAGLRSLSEREPAEALRRLLASVGRPMTVQEVKDHFAGVVDDPKWSGFWTAARKNKQVLLSGSGKSALVSWSESADAAEESVRAAFAAAGPAEKMELARKNAKRSKELARVFAAGLAEQARRAALDRPGLAWELSQSAARLAPGEPEAFPASELLAVQDAAAVLSDVRDQGARQSALEAIRAGRSDWAAVFAERIPKEDDGRVLGVLFEGLGDGAADLTRRILRSPRTAPRAFVWLCERVEKEGKTDTPSLFFSLLEALRQDEFSGLRARVKEFFDPGGLAVTLVRAAPSEDEAREMLAALDRAGGLEDHRRSLVKEALLMRYPELRAPAREYLYATAEAIEARRKELQTIRSVDLPANAEAMRTAKEHGDLRENFEYHAARQKHEYLSARIALLADELSRTRPLDPAKIDVSEVRVGTRVTLRNAGTGAERAVTILGPWDSKPEEAVYSYQSEFAVRLLGAKPGETVSLQEGEVVVVAIEPWRSIP